MISQLFQVRIAWIPLDMTMMIIVAYICMSQYKQFHVQLIYHDQHIVEAMDGSKDINLL